MPDQKTQYLCGLHVSTRYFKRNFVEKNMGNTDKINVSHTLTLLLVAGLEPARGCPRGILSPLRLPIPPHQRTHMVKARAHRNVQWMGVDSNHRSNLQQIYSLSPLATREPIHVADITP